MAITRPVIEWLRRELYETESEAPQLLFDVPLNDTISPFF